MNLSDDEYKQLTDEQKEIAYPLAEVIRKAYGPTYLRVSTAAIVVNALVDEGTCAECYGQWKTDFDNLLMNYFDSFHDHEGHEHV